MRKSKKVALLITGSVVLAACNRQPQQPRPSGAGGDWSSSSPSPSPTPVSHWWYFFGRSYGGGSSWHWFGGGTHSGSSWGSSSHSSGVSRGGFGSHGGSGGHGSSSS